MMYLTRLSKISGEFKVQQTEKSDYSDFQKGPGIGGRINESRGGQSGHAPIMVLWRGLVPFPMLQKELLKVGGSWRSPVFFARFACDYISIAD